MSLLITKSLAVSHNNSISARFGQRREAVIDSNMVYHGEAAAVRERHTDEAEIGRMCK